MTKSTKRAATSATVSLILSIVTVTSYAQNNLTEDRPVVTAPPESFFELVDPRDRDVARQFYRKYVLVNDMPVTASQEVADQALERTHWIVSHLLQGRPDISQ